jgi:hypothetical protein
MYLNPPFWPSESQAIYAPLHSFHPFLLRTHLVGGDPLISPFSDRPKMVAQCPALPSLTSRLSHPQRLFKRPPKRHTGIDYPLGMPDTSDTFLAIPHMVNHPSPFTAPAYTY